MEEKVRENRTRRKAERQNLLLQKFRRRDPDALGFGTYRLVDASSHETVAGRPPTGFGLTLDEIEEELTKPK